MNSDLIKMAVVGNPIIHSLSPELFGYWGEKYQKNILYNRIISDNPDEILHICNSLNINYLNITSPLKNKFFSVSQKRDLSSYIYFAVNFFNVNQKNAFNFDAIGLSSILSKNHIAIHEKKILIIGAGDTAALIIDFIKQFKNNEITVFNRTENKAKKLSHIKRINYINDLKNISNFDIIFSTIPDFREYVDESKIKDTTVLIDLNYSINKGKHFKFKYFNGLHWLIYQAMPVMIMLYQILPNFDETYQYLSKLKKEKSKIALIGFSGAGKTTIGEKLAEKINYDYYDTDQIIEKYTGLEIPLIFDKFGIDYFRNLEAKILEYFETYKNVIISTGGGIIENPKSIEILKAYDNVIYIYSDLEQSISRINIEQKPVIKNLDSNSIKALFNQRKEKYFSSCNSIVYNNDDLNKTNNLIYENFR